MNRRTAILAAAGATLAAASETPLACNLKALTAAERVAHKERTVRVFQDAKLTPLADGYAIALPAGTWSEAAQWVELERKCCPFLRFQLESAAESGDVVLRLTGRNGVKAFLEEELRLKK